MTDPLEQRITHGLLNALGQAVTNFVAPVAARAAKHAAKGLRKARSEARQTKARWDRITEALDDIAGDE